MIRMLIALLALISLLALANNVYYFLNSSVGCEEYYNGSVLGNVVIWSLVRLVTNYSSLFYTLYLFWHRSEKPPTQRPTTMEMDANTEEDGRAIYNRMLKEDESGEEPERSDESSGNSPRISRIASTL